MSFFKERKCSKGLPFNTPIAKIDGEETMWVISYTVVVFSIFNMDILRPYFLYLIVIALSISI